MEAELNKSNVPELLLLPVDPLSMETSWAVTISFSLVLQNSE